MSAVPGGSIHLRFVCVLNRLFRHKRKKTSKLRVNGFCKGSRVDSAHKGPVTRKMFPFDDVIMSYFGVCVGFYNKQNKTQI